MNKKYLTADLIKYYLNHKFSHKSYSEYKNYLDACLLLNSGFNFGKYKEQGIKISTAQTPPSSMVKVAFDTRKINQETDYNPRRGLQNYNRSESYINDSQKEKVSLLKKMYQAVSELKETYGKEEEWQDSYARVLHGVIEKTFNKIKSAGELTEAQPSLGSLDYIEELLYVRYRLAFDNVKDLDNFEIKKIILSKDENLVVKPIVHGTKTITGLEALSGNNNDNLLIKLFGDIKATAENKSVERTVTITIKDSIVDDKQKIIK